MWNLWFPISSYTTLVAVKTFFIVKTSFIIYKFTWIHINSHNFYTYVLKCIFWGSNYFRVYGQKLNLKKSNILNNLVLKRWRWTKIFLKTEPEKKKKKKRKWKTTPGKKNFFIKISTTSKNFCNIDVYKRKPKIIVNWLQSS